MVRIIPEPAGNPQAFPSVFMTMKAAALLICVVAVAAEDAGSLRRQGRYAEAEAVLRDALRDQPEDAQLLLDLGTVLFLQNRLTDAEEALKRSLAIQETAPGLTTLARLHQVAERPTEAEVLLLRVVAIREGPDELQELARFYLRQERWAVAEPRLRRALELLEAQYGPDHQSLLPPLDILASVCQRLQRPGEAEALFRRALALRETQLGPMHQDVASTLDGLGAVAYDQQRYPEAEALYGRSLGIWTVLLGADHPLMASHLESFAAALAGEGKHAEAEVQYRKALAIRETGVVRNGHNVCLLLEAQGKPREAARLYHSHQALLDRLPADSELRAAVKAAAERVSGSRGGGRAAPSRKPGPGR